MTRPIWKYKLLMYENYFRDEQKNAQYLEDRIVNIPSSIVIDGKEDHRIPKFVCGT